MDAPQRSSPAFYKGMAIVFFLLGAMFIALAVYQHSWTYGIVGVITIMNGLVSTLKSLAARET